LGGASQHGCSRLHPGATLANAAWRRPIDVNLGFVTLAGETTLRPALDLAIQRGLADGGQARRAAEEGVTWVPSVAPDVGRGPSLQEPMAD
jgi:hypothetical protein